MKILEIKTTDYVERSRDLVEGPIKKIIKTDLEEVIYKEIYSLNNKNGSINNVDLVEKIMDELKVRILNSVAKEYLIVIKNDTEKVLKEVLGGEE